MSNLHYPWKRFWLPLGTEPNLDDDGFLYDPEHESTRFYNPEAKLLEEYSENSHCLVLLGEPGIGKSTVFKDEISRLNYKLENEKHLIHIDLAEYRDETRLINELFSSDRFQNWLNGGYTLYILLDSLDECSISIDQFPLILTRSLERVKQQLSRLHLHIACRTSVWSQMLQKDLKDLFEGFGYQELSLAPLRRTDVEEAARIEGFNPEEFGEAISRAEAGVWASIPLTLNLLIDQFRSTEKLPESKYKIFESGCRELAKKHTPIRRLHNRFGVTEKLGVNERLIVAARIAAISIFCSKPYFSIDDRDETSESSTLSLSDICGYHEEIDGVPIPIKDDLVYETLGTALFTGKGNNILKFVNHSFAEFLASYYFKIHGTDSKRILRLIRESGHDSLRVIPQLQTTVSWIVGWSKEILLEISADHPKIALVGDMSLLNDEEKQKIVGSYLTQISDGEERYDHQLWRYYYKFGHAGLTQQLTPWIQDTSKSRMVRMEAIRIALQCEVIDLQGLFVQIALDKNEEIEIRSDAARAVATIGDIEHKRQLLPLLASLPEEDRDDELRGNVLCTLWPDVISAQQLFQNLPVPRRGNYLGAYANFLSFELHEEIVNEDLAYALEWVRQNAETDDYQVQRLSDQILLLALQNLDDEILNDLAITCLSLFEAHHLFHERDNVQAAATLLEDPLPRRRLVAAIVKNVNPSNTMLSYHIRSCNPPLITTDDLSWLIYQVESETESEKKGIWAELLVQTFDITNIIHVELIIKASQDSVEVSENFSYFLGSVDKDSVEAQKQREKYQQVHSYQNKYEAKPKGPTQRERIESILQQIDEGNPEAWAVLPYHMANEFSDDHNFPSNDITLDSGWRNSDNETRVRIVSSAVEYLHHGKSEPDRWLGKTQFKLGDTVPFQAFYLFWRHFPEHLDNLDESIWRKWGAYFLGPIIINDVNDPAYDLISEAYRRAPDEIIETLTRIIWVEATNKQSIHILDRVKKCVDQRMGDALADLLPLMELVPENWNSVISFLIRNDYDPAAERAKAILKERDLTSQRELHIMAAATLLRYRPEESWDLIWNILSTDKQLGKELIKRYAHRFEIFESSNYHMLPVIALRDLYIWLAEEFSYDEDPEYVGAYSPSEDDHVRELRDAILRSLTGMGTKESADAINHIKNSLPNLDWLKIVAVDARDATVQKSWIPLEPSDFLKFILETDSVLITNPSDLQELVIEALKEYEITLQGETALIENLWNEIEKGVYKPKGENHLSNNIKCFFDLFLKGRNIVCAREAEARPSQETDIMVMAKIPGSDPIKVIIETKGCWHKDLRKAMKLQLVDRYLDKNQCRHGIYLIGRFHCAKWEKSISRAKWPLERVQREFAKQAAELSDGDLSIKAFVMDTSLLSP